MQDLFPEGMKEDLKMKKIISLVLMLAMLLSVSAFAEEEFTLHNGLKFGMTKEEVYETEKAAGVQLTEDEIFDYVWKGTIAGQINSKLEISINGDFGLSTVYYSFDSLESYDTLNNGLIEKYGKTPYSSETGVYLDEPTTDHINSLPYVFTDTYSNARYSQWLIPYSNTQSIFIHHYVFQRDRISFTEKFESFSRVEHVISYELLSEYETEEYRNPYSGDL